MKKKNTVIKEEAVKKTAPVVIDKPKTKTITKPAQKEVIVKKNKKNKASKEQIQQIWTTIQTQIDENINKGKEINSEIKNSIAEQLHKTIKVYPNQGYYLYYINKYVNGDIPINQSKNGVALDKDAQKKQVTTQIESLKTQLGKLK